MLFRSWGVLIIAVAGVVGLILALVGHGRLTPSLALCWGLAWVAFARLTDVPESIPTAVAAIVAVVAVVVTTVVARLRAIRHPATTEAVSA